MFDLEQNLCHWRQEIEATLAFSSEEIDELEDHLRFSFDAKITEGLTPENSWARSLGGLGSASALALEFAKDKLMPALGRLLVSWWKPGILLILFGGIWTYSFSIGPMLTDAKMPVTFVREPAFWVILWLSVVVTLILLPNKAQKNAVLLGLGNAFCLLPLLHLMIYNAASEKIIGVGWSHMAASFGWLPVSLSLVGLVIVNVWWWKKSVGLGKEFPVILNLVATLILVLALSPVMGEAVGNLSIREIYHMPTFSQVTYTGEVRSDFQKWKFVEVLATSVLGIANFLPFALAFLIAGGILLTQSWIRKKKVPEVMIHHDAFPSLPTIPWIMTLVGSGLCWVVGHWIEPPFSENVRQLWSRNFYPDTSYGGLEIMVLFSAAFFFICGVELTKRLAAASSIRPFYAVMLVVFELAVALALPFLSTLWETMAINPAPEPRSAQPPWLSWTLGITLLLMALTQLILINRKMQRRPGQVSLWKFEGRNLVEFGLSLGLVFAVSWLIFTMVAVVMAYESTTVISAMIAWGESIKDPARHFYPQMYGTPDHLAFWVACGITYLSFCLAVGLGMVIFLSALEFIRFNCFRLYKVRRIRREFVQALAANE